MTKTILDVSGNRNFALGRISEGARNALSKRMPWLEMVDQNALTMPESVAEPSNTIRKNWTYFRVNYLLLLCGVLAFSLVSQLVCFFLLVALLGALDLPLSSQDEGCLSDNSDRHAIEKK